jgi:hypothetical protein
MQAMVRECFSRHNFVHVKFLVTSGTYKTNAQIYKPFYLYLNF